MYIAPTNLFAHTYLGEMGPYLVAVSSNMPLFCLLIIAQLTGVLFQATLAGRWQTVHRCLQVPRQEVRRFTRPSAPRPTRWDETGHSDGRRKKKAERHVPRSRLEKALLLSGCRAPPDPGKR